jgi:uncharacterized protein (TIGR00251 family)
MQVLTIKVEPQAHRDEVKQISPTEYEVAVTAPAKEGKANKQVIKNLARFFNTSPSNLIVSKGERWNTKTILFLDD